MVPTAVSGRGGIAEGFPVAACTGRVIPRERSPDRRDHNGLGAPTTPRGEAEEDTVRVEVNSDICEGHGQCNAVAPEIYDLDDSGYCLIRNPDVPPELE